MPRSDPPSASLPVPGPPPGGSPKDRAVGTLAGLLQDIAACRAGIVRKEAAIADLERRLHGEGAALESQWIELRVQTFRALGRLLREGRLNRKSHRTLAQALGALADELESDFGADLRTDRRLYLGEDAEPPEEDAPVRGRPASRKQAGSRKARGEGSGSAGGGRASGASGAAGHGGAGAFGEDGKDVDDGADPGASAGRGGGGRRRTDTRAAQRRAAQDQALSGDIRALYLILARALHPDKEPNPALREAKTAWMQKVTAAYSRKDLAMLLDILARNPLEAVGPYLAEAPLKTVQGFAKRLRRDLSALRQQAARLDEWLHPSLARFLKDGSVDEARLARHFGELKRAVRLARQRLEAYRTPEGAEHLVAGLRVHGWRDLL